MPFSQSPTAWVYKVKSVLNFVPAVFVAWVVHIQLCTYCWYMPAVKVVHNLKSWLKRIQRYSNELAREGALEKVGATLKTGLVAPSTNNFSGATKNRVTPSQWRHPWIEVDIDNNPQLGKLNVDSLVTEIRQTNRCNKQTQNVEFWLLTSFSILVGGGKSLALAIARILSQVKLRWYFTFYGKVFFYDKF